MDRERMFELAKKKPLAVCLTTGMGAGHLVGIPPRLLEYRDPIFDLVPEGAKKVVEVGSLQGWFAWRCCKYLPDALVYCVDPYLDSKEYGSGAYNLQCFRQNLRAHLGSRVFLLQGPSDKEAGAILDDEVDFLFIDGDHREAGVLLDLESWYPKVRGGGLVSGHDIDGVWGKDVRSALETFCPRHGIREVHVAKAYSFTGVQETPVWYFYKPQEQEAG